MTLEDQLKQLPKPVLAGLAIFVAIVLLFILKPPYTICDAQKENIRTNMAGVLFPTKMGKDMIPGRVHKAMEVCLFGNSGGACYEYFDILRKAARSVKAASQECTASLLGVTIQKYAKMEQYQEVRDGKKIREELASVTYKEVRLEQVLWDGLEIMVEKAWGEVPPEPGAQRFGWFKESEMNSFCHVRDVLIRAKGRQGFMNAAKKIYPKLPGEAVQRDVAGAGLAVAVPRKATQMFRENDIYERSLLSAPCDYFR